MPAELRDLRAFFTGTLFPLAIASGAMPPDDAQGLAACWRNRNKLSPAQDGMVTLMMAASAAFSLWKAEPDGDAWAQMARAALDLAPFMHGFLSASSGTSSEHARKALAVAAAAARHAVNRRRRDEAIGWYKEHRQSLASKGEAAEYISSHWYVSFDTARDWLKGV